MHCRSTIAFIIKPSAVSCCIQRILPGLSFSMIYGSVLTKTNRIARILARGKKKIITRKPRCMTTKSLVVVTSLLILLESSIIIAILIWQPGSAKVSFYTLQWARVAWIPVLELSSEIRFPDKARKFNKNAGVSWNGIYL